MTEPAQEVVLGTSRLPRLTSLRWYAALLVLLYHADAVLDWQPLGFFDFGQQGVTFFFVLSGFVLAWNYRPTSPARGFWWRRFARIYPSHLVMTAVAVTLGVAGSSHFYTGVAGVAATTALVQAWVPVGSIVYAANSPSWSLSCEAFFYALFPWIFAVVQRYNRLLIVAAMLTVLVGTGLATVVLGRHGLGFPFAYTNPVVRLPEFALGVALARLVRAGLRSPVPMWVAVGFSLATAVASRWGSFPYFFLPAIVLLIITAATLDQAHRPGPLTWKASVWLGEISFALYLVHQIVLFALDDVAGLRGPGALVVTLVTSILAAAALHHLVELPVQRRLTRVPTSAPALSA